MEEPPLNFTQLAIIYRCTPSNLLGHSSKKVLSQAKGYAYPTCVSNCFCLGFNCNAFLWRSFCLEAFASFYAYGPFFLVMLIFLLDTANTMSTDNIVTTPSPRSVSVDLLHSQSFNVNVLPIACFVVPCTPGTYYDSVARECVECEKGTYQNSSAQTTCKHCPTGKSTMSIGAKSADDCIGIHLLLLSIFAAMWSSNPLLNNTLSEDFNKETEI